MAALTVRAVKLAAISGAAVPVIGYSGRLLAKSVDGDLEEQTHAIRACDIPMYQLAKRIPEPVKDEPKDEPNAVQKQITQIRIFGTDIYRQVMGSPTVKGIQDGYEVVKDKALIGVEHSKATLDYVQNNPGDLPRVGVITMASLGGFVIGFRRGIVRKLFYASVAGISAAAICYPHYTVDLSRAFAEDCKCLWRSNIGWPLTDESDKKKPDSKASTTESKVLKVLKLKEDHGQSKSEDKDLYSTRSS